MGFYFAPPNVAGDTRPDAIWFDASSHKATLKETLSLLWAR